MTAEAMTEERMVFLVRNALLVAGQEMGRGDEWPVVKDTIYKIMKDWEALKIERAVDDELKVHLYQELQAMEQELPNCEPDIREILEPRFKELRDVLDAYFAEIDPAVMEWDLEDAAPHIQRMYAILATMEDDHD